MIVHDEVIIDCEKSLCDSIADILLKEMKSGLPGLQVPLNIKINTGNSWASLK